MGAAEAPAVGAVVTEPLPWKTNGVPSEWYRAFEEVWKELEAAASNWPPFNSAHEGYGVIDEEFEELKEHIFMNQKKRDLDAMRKEAKQLAAMAVRFMVEVCNEERGRK